jgi:copper homeostasis protein
LVEVVCCSVDDVVAAEIAGADRIELCTSIEVGGLTPSIGLITEALSKTALPLVVMVRCRAGGFTYSAPEMAVMRRDAEAAMATGASGIAFGALRPDRDVDFEGCERVLRGITGSHTFHRAFDQTPDLLSSLETVKKLGFARILTSGGAPTALEGAPSLAGLVEAAKGSLDIVAAGSIRSANFVEVVNQSGVSQIHLGPFTETDAAGAYGSELRLDAREVARVCGVKESR